MKADSQTRRRPTGKMSSTVAGFPRVWNRLLGAARLPAVALRRGRKPRVPLRDVLAALTCHVEQGTGTVTEHFAQWFGIGWANSPCSDRRRRLP
jgi:hypothetical protein